MNRGRSSPARTAASVLGLPVTILPHYSALLPSCTVTHERSLGKPLFSCRRMPSRATRRYSRVCTIAPDTVTSGDGKGQDTLFPETTKYLYRLLGISVLKNTLMMTIIRSFLPSPYRWHCFPGSSFPPCFRTDSPCSHYTIFTRYRTFRATFKGSSQLNPH